MVTDLEKDIFRSVAYFSYFNFPLTIFEIWKWQLKPSVKHDLHEIALALEDSIFLKEQLQNYNGFWGIEQSVRVEEQVGERHRRYLDGVIKVNKLRRVLKYLVRLPSVEGLAVCNSLALQHTRPESDIDLFVITSPKRIWETRFLSVAPLAVLRQRPGEVKHHPLDVSFFVSRDNLNLEHLKLEGDDPYLSLWLATLTPVYGATELWQDFFEKNQWVKKELPCFEPRLASNELRQKQAKKLPLPNIENWTKGWQEKRLPQAILDLKNKDSRVIVSDTMLKFHKNDRRAEIAAALREATKICESK